MKYLSPSLSLTPSLSLPSLSLPLSLSPLSLSSLSLSPLSLSPLSLSLSLSLSVNADPSDVPEKRQQDDSGEGDRQPDRLTEGEEREYPPTPPPSTVVIFPRCRRYVAPV